ncbi:hypothetical protein PAAG_06551 [Paracoccidioides lutzii Pb01]|uniref:Uncharacterized protein n=1 Tax=Paracoccidioides lutzii (strain ATCC MYA-826 / Pb01) TaxID=502779 RepID=C1H710_PARBA|nr:hypothetical protein PAAG_06551 [Paracoccidioides lutzii Pb01]EEH35504.2 hypothetical protein PAAG_06551 [Paracoccidioides lutzii Pb01]
MQTPLVSLPPTPVVDTTSLKLSLPGKHLRVTITGRTSIHAPLHEGLLITLSLNAYNYRSYTMWEVTSNVSHRTPCPVRPRNGWMKLVGRHTAFRTILLSSSANGQNHRKNHVDRNSQSQTLRYSNAWIMKRELRHFNLQSVRPPAVDSFCRCAVQQLRTSARWLRGTTRWTARGTGIEEGRVKRPYLG